jgi:hypothetical protein
MRLSDERIQFICKELVDSLLKKSLIKFRGNAPNLVTALARVVLSDLAIEDQIDAEAQNIIRSMKREIPEGSSEWHSIFLQKKEEIARRKNYIL